MSLRAKRDNLNALVATLHERVDYRVTSFLALTFILVVYWRREMTARNDR
jgi:hypothetical protein